MKELMFMLFIIIWDGTACHSREGIATGEEGSWAVAAALWSYLFTSGQTRKQWEMNAVLGSFSPFSLYVQSRTPAIHGLQLPPPGWVSPPLLNSVTDTPKSCFVITLDSTSSNQTDGLGRRDGSVSQYRRNVGTLATYPPLPPPLSLIVPG